MEILIRTLQLKENKEILCNKVNHVLSISIRISRLHCKKKKTVLLKKLATVAVKTFTKNNTVMKYLSKVHFTHIRCVTCM